MMMMMILLIFIECFFLCYTFSNPKSLEQLYKVEQYYGSMLRHSNRKVAHLDAASESQGRNAVPGSFFCTGQFLLM